MLAHHPLTRAAAGFGTSATSDAQARALRGTATTLEEAANAS